MESVTGRRNFVTEYKNPELLENTAISIPSLLQTLGKLIYFLTYNVIHESAVLTFKDCNTIPLYILMKSFPPSLEMYMLLRFSPPCNETTSFLSATDLTSVCFNLC